MVTIAEELTPQEIAEADQLLSAFSQTQQKGDMAQVLKELFDEQKIYLIGDMTKDEIRLATRIYTIAKMKKIKIWEQALNFYVRLLLSRDRQSRREIIDAVRGYYSPPSLLQRLNPRNWIRKGMY